MNKQMDKLNELFIKEIMPQVDPTDKAPELTARHVAREYGERAAQFGLAGYEMVKTSYDNICVPLFGHAVDYNDWEFACRDTWSWKMADFEDVKENGNMDTKKKLKIVMAFEGALHEFMKIMAAQDDEFFLENEAGTVRVNAKSALGTLYMYKEHGGVGHTFFLINESHDGVFPAMTGIDGYHQF